MALRGNIAKVLGYVGVPPGERIGTRTGRGEVFVSISCQATCYFRGPASETSHGEVDLMGSEVFHTSTQVGIMEQL